MAGASTKKRQEDDFYPTPPEVTAALMIQETDYLYDYRHIIGRGGAIWEPACGDGAISKVVENYGFEVHSTDLRDRGFGQGGRDFLKETTPLARQIITNPPFNLAERFIRHGRAIGCLYQAYLLKATFFHAQTRYALFCEYPPARIYPLLWRADFLGLKSPTMECAWFVWDDEDYVGETLYRPLPRPGDGGTLSLFDERPEQEGEI